MQYTSFIAHKEFDFKKKKTHKKMGFDWWVIGRGCVRTMLSLRIFLKPGLDATVEKNN